MWSLPVQKCFKVLPPPTLIPLAVYAAVRHAYGPRDSGLRNHVSFTSKYLLESRVPDFLTDCFLCI